MQSKADTKYSGACTVLLAKLHGLLYFLIQGSK